VTPRHGRDSHLLPDLPTAKVAPVLSETSSGLPAPPKRLIHTEMPLVEQLLASRHVRHPPEEGLRHLASQQPLPVLAEHLYVPDGIAHPQTHESTKEQVAVQLLNQLALTRIEHSTCNRRACSTFPGATEGHPKRQPSRDKSSSTAIYINAYRARWTRPNWPSSVSCWNGWPGSPRSWIERSRPGNKRNLFPTNRRMGRCTPSAGGTAGVHLAAQSDHAVELCRTNPAWKMLLAGNKPGRQIDNAVEVSAIFVGGLWAGNAWRHTMEEG
jgi:hypothetical protein